MEKIPTMNEKMKILFEQCTQELANLKEIHWKMALEMLSEFQSKIFALNHSYSQLEQEHQALAETNQGLEARMKQLEQQLFIAKLELSETKKLVAIPKQSFKSSNIESSSDGATEHSKDEVVELHPREFVQTLREKCGIDVKINPEMKHWVDNLQSTLQR
jgi:hypothetical protein